MKSPRQDSIGQRRVEKYFLGSHCLLISLLSLSVCTTAQQSISKLPKLVLFWWKSPKVSAKGPWCWGCLTVSGALLYIHICNFPEWLVCDGISVRAVTPSLFLAGTPCSHLDHWKYPGIKFSSGRGCWLFHQTQKWGHFSPGASQASKT